MVTLSHDTLHHGYPANLDMARLGILIPAGMVGIVGIWSRNGSRSFMIMLSLPIPKRSRIIALPSTGPSAGSLKPFSA